MERIIYKNEDLNELYEHFKSNTLEILKSDLKSELENKKCVNIELNNDVMTSVSQHNIDKKCDLDIEI